MTSRINIVLVLLALTAPVAIAQVGPDNGRIGHYLLNGNALDASISANHGKLFGPDATTDRFKRPGHALNFKDKQYAEIPADVFHTAEFTYTIWANVSVIQPAGQGSTVFFVCDESLRGHGLGLDNGYGSLAAVGWGVGSFSMGSRQVIGLTTGVLPEAGRWYHLAVTRSRTSLVIYVDGVKKNSATANAPPYYSDMLVCRLGLNFRGQSFTGKLDDVSIYNRALSEREIQHLYTAERDLPTKP